MQNKIWDLNFTFDRSWEERNGLKGICHYFKGDFETPQIYQ